MAAQANMTSPPNRVVVFFGLDVISGAASEIRKVRTKIKVLFPFQKQVNDGNHNNINNANITDNNY